MEHRLNSTNYVLRRTAKSKPFVVHVDRMRKLPQDALPDGESHGSGGSSDNTRTHASTDIASDKQQPATQADGRGSVTVSRPTDSAGVVSPAEPADSTVRSSTGASAADAGDATSTAGAGLAPARVSCPPVGTQSSRATSQSSLTRPRPPPAARLQRPQRQRRQPARYLGNLRAQCNLRVPSGVSVSPSSIAQLSKLSQSNLASNGSVCCCLLADQFEMSFRRSAVHPDFMSESSSSSDSDRDGSDVNDATESPPTQSSDPTVQPMDSGGASDAGDIAPVELLLFHRWP